MAEITFNAHELDRLDLFATQQLLALVAATLLEQSPDPRGLREKWAQDLERLVEGFGFQNAPAEKVPPAREYLLNAAHGILSQCVVLPSSGRAK